MKVSIVICTYNRAELVRECLESLVQQTMAHEHFEVIIVDNNSPDHTAEVAKTFVDQYPNFRYVKEENVGLSHARNRGWKEAKCQWVAYVDDDALAAENFVARIYWFLEHHDYRMFGGHWGPWYKYGQPYWMKDKYCSKKILADRIITIPHRYTASGGVMVIEKTLLEQYNGFDTALGMAGDKVGYSEETDFQNRIRKDGIEVGYDPDLIIHHLVAKYKLNVDWYFKSAFALGRDMVKSKMVATGFLPLLGSFLIGFGVMLKDLIIYTPQLLRKNYYIENWLIDVFKKMAKRIGMIYTGIMMNRGE